QRLTFLPEPGLVIFAPPNSENVYVLPVDMPALLKAAGRDLVFASVPPAEARAGRAYSYRPSVIGAQGQLAFALEAGPANMQITKEGLLTWAAPDATQPTNDVKITARDADGRRVSQTFRLLVSKEVQVA